MAPVLFLLLYSVWHHTCHVESLTCQSCLGAKHPMDCKATTCAPGQICFVEEALTVTSPQEVRFNLGCESQQICQSLTVSNHGRRHLESRDKDQVPSVTACFRCCDSDLCNRGNCSALDWCASSPCSNGATCENTDTGFLCHCPSGFTGNTCSQDVNECLSGPCQNGGTCVNYPGSSACVCPLRYEGPHCELRSKGTVCQTCTGVSSPLLCNNASVCKGNEECYTDQVQSEGQVTFNMGCRTEAFCSFYKQYAQVGRRQAHAITTCTDCCRHDHCNRDVCREEPAGLICISCDRVGSREDCHNVTVCDATQECYGREEVDLSTGRKSFSAGCLDTQVCASVTNMAVGKRDVTTSLGTCVECCGHHYCNKELCVGATTSTPASTPTTASASTTPAVRGVCDTLPFSPCHHGGTCVNSADGAFLCLCPQGFSGRSCSTGPSTSAETTVPSTATTADPCLSLVCQHGGSCVVTGGTAKCACVGDYTGAQCEVDPCTFAFCQNSAPCLVSSEGKAQCQCPGGFSGPHCQHSLCDSSPCHNGGSCHVDKGAVTCHCPGNFTGQHCESRICHFVDINSIGCGRPQDVAILLSGGERTTTSVAGHMAHFVETLVKNPGTRVDASHTHVAVAYFDSAPHTICPLSSDPSQVSAAMRSHSFYHYHGPKTSVHLDTALDFVRTTLLSQGRPDSDKVILAILGEVETDAASLRAAAGRLQDECVSLNVVALEQLATKPDNDDASSSLRSTLGLSHTELAALSAMLAVYDDPEQHRKYVPTSTALDSSAWSQFFQSSALCASSRA